MRAFHRLADTVKTPPQLQILIDDGVIDEVLRPLKSGKEASVYTPEVEYDLATRRAA